MKIQKWGAGTETCRPPVFFCRADLDGGLRRMYDKMEVIQFLAGAEKPGLCGEDEEIPAVLTL